MKGTQEVRALTSRVFWRTSKTIQWMAILATLFWLFIQRDALMQQELRSVSQLTVALVAIIASTGIISELAERALRASEEKYGILVHRDRTVRAESGARYRGLMEAAPDAMVVVDPSGSIVLLNLQAEKQFGYQRNELIGQQLTSIIPKGFAERLIADSLRSPAEALAQQIGSGIELIGRRKNGSEFPIEIMLSPLENAMGVLVTAAIRDITARLNTMAERNALQAQLLQIQKMESIGQLAGGVAHDINNLMGVVIGYGELTLGKLEAESPLRQNVEGMQSAAERAVSIVRQLLAFSRKQIQQPRMLDLNRVVNGMEELLRRLIGEDIRLTISTGSDLGAIRADTGQMEQVIMNLAVNARDAMPHGGDLTIRTENVELEGDDPLRESDTRTGPHVMLSVSDTGCGMDSTTQARIFEPFYTTKELGRGTGLGLSVVYGIVKQNWGSISVRSEPECGTVIKICLPREAGVPEPITTVKASADALQGSETVLLVEDAGPLREVVRQFLEQGGYTVLAAEDGCSALAIAENHVGPIDLLLTDVVMPGLSGPQLAENLHLGRPELLVIYMSGYTDDALGKHGVLEQDVTMLEKPFTRDSLLRKLREVLDTKVAHSLTISPRGVHG